MPGRSPPAGRTAADPARPGGTGRGARASRAAPCRDIGRRPGLRRLHVRVDGQAEGRRAHARGPVEPGALAPARVRRHSRGSRHADRRRRLRRRRLGDLALSHGGGQRAHSRRGDPAGSRGAARLAGVRKDQPDVPAHPDGRAGDSLAVARPHRPAHPADGGRHPAPLPATGSAVHGGEQLWSDRVHGGRHLGAGLSRQKRDRPAHHRAADRGRAGSPPGRIAAAGASGETRRAVHRRRRRGQGLRRPTRPDEGAVHPGSVQHGARGASVQDRRPGPASAGRPARLPGPDRRADQGPRLSHRAGRDRRGAQPTSGGRGKRRRRPPGSAGGHPPGRLLRACSRKAPQPRGAAGISRDPSSRLHGARDFPGSPVAAAQCQRQGRPRGPSRAGGGPAPPGRSLHCAAHPGGAAHRRDSGASSAPRSRRRS